MEKEIKFYKETLTPGHATLHGVVKKVCEEKSPFQKIEIYDTSDFGRVLFLDETIQSAEVDEAIYHEALIHPAMCAVKEPKRALVIGGGEGAALREIYRHPSVEEAWLIDIDEKVIELSKKHLPEWNAGAYADARSKVVSMDARKWLEENDKKFDCAFLDLNEPMEKGPSYLLFTREFFKILFDRLTDEGVVAVQSGPAWGPDSICFAAIAHTMKTVFPYVRVMHAEVATFSSLTK